MRTCKQSLISRLVCLSRMHSRCLNDQNQCLSYRSQFLPDHQTRDTPHNQSLEINDKNMKSGVLLDDMYTCKKQYRKFSLYNILKLVRNKI